ncbi:stimulated by retinoic acid gene 6 protein-like isoform X5 [Hemicordylus capensis]|uniref:stimulated by retinoic acid gene 6 protein-like isoform X5 n=1 Tax=Hemicordylus capensis TaxID=884348 RepID=UPI002303C94E|nr:stimulated by retinoic acid gene 6 protein-like isoform X5 [Hemicordylus capensis]
MATRMVSTESWQLKNETCRSSVDLDLFLHYSLLPSVAIIMVLSCLEKRARGHQVDERFPLLNRRCGTVIPLDFVGAFDNRWSLGFAFGATANKVMIMFSEGDFLLYVPQWAQAFVLLIGAFEVGLSSYPFFACLSTCFQITGATLGFLYTGFWLVIMVMHIVQCPHGQIIGHYEKIMFYWPSLLCLVFLLSRFVHIFVKTLWIRFRLHLLNEETSFLEVHQAQYVQQLLRKPPLQQSQKSWIQRKVYDWDPYFRFPTRMISMAVLATICLYIHIKSSCIWCPARERAYWHHRRKHMKRLWAGEKQFLPLGFSKLSSSQSVAAIARYSGWQIAYILWGQLVIHTVQCLFGVMFMYSFVLPIKKGQGIEMVKTLGTGILTLAVVIGLMLLQVVTAASFFLQPKISQDDKEKPLALDNRKVFHNFNYFLFFYNVLLGLGACLFRLLCSVIVGAWLIARIDRTIMPKGYEAADMGFRTWIGMLFMDHYHTNPTLVCFCHILVVRNRERQQQQQQQQQRTTNYYHFSNVADFRVLNKARTRWLLLYTLLNNPSLSALRKPQ